MPTPRRAPAIALVALLYAVAVQLTFRTSLPSGAIAFWPPAGLAAVLLALGGRDLWPGIVAGAFAAKVGRDGTAALAGAVGPAVEAVVAATALGTLRRPDRRAVEHVAALALFAGGAAASAALGATALWLQGSLIGPHFITGFARWALGDLVGLLPALALAVPAFVADRRRPSPAVAAEHLAAAGATIATGWLVFHAHAGQLSLVPLPALWVVLRCGLPTGMATALTVSAIGIWATVDGHGPFATGQADDVLVAQIFALSFTVVMLLLSALTEDRRRVAAAHRQMSAEDAALRRVATAVAGDATPEEVARLASCEVAHLLGVETGAVMVFEDDGARVRALGRYVAPGIDDRHADDARDVLPGGVVAAARDRGAPARIDERDAPMRLAPPFLQRVAAPVFAHGELWGVIVASTARECPLAKGAEDRLGRFAELVGLAMAHADAHARLLARATTDPLTGLLNHRAFHERLIEEVALAHRGGRALSLVVLDLDRFKQVNDTLGHLVGDAVLAEAGRRIRDAARAGEAVARIGGDELAVLLPGTAGAEAHRAAERIRAAASAERFAGVGAMTLSAGVCDLERAGDAERLLRLADGALYWAKAHGRDASIEYDPEVVEELSATERAERLEHARTLGALGALARAIDAKDPATIRHSERVADLAAALAEASGWQPHEVRRLHDAALVHDVGKIGVPDAVLSAPRRLTAAEYELIQRHADLGARIVAGVLDADQVAWVRGHHERHDGRGYPDGLEGPAISEGARLLALADAWDAMTGARVYSEPMTAQDAFAEVLRNDGTQFHPDAVAALRELHAAGRIGAQPATAAA